MIKRLLAVFLLGCLARADVVLHEKVAQLPFMHPGPFVRAGDGTIWGMDTRGALRSKDEGRNWTAKEIFDPARFQPSGERALLRTKEGVILYAFLNRKELVFKWDDKQGGPLEGCRVPVYLSRSADDGVTWAPPVLLQDGWCGAVRQMIHLRSGRVLLICQQARANPGRHVTINYYSDDLGQTWRASNVIDLGEAGNYRDPVTGLNATTHGGAIEGTVVERRDGTLKLLLRVPHGCFYESTSRDGAKWSVPTPSTLEASDSPGMMERLASGRVALVWNRFRDPVKRTGRREHLAIAFSENDGLTWTTPQIIASHLTPPGKKEGAYWVSYPYIFEVAPGRLWVSTMQGRFSGALDERDFLSPVANPLDGPAVRIVTLGDSITKGARPGVSPTETFSARLQGALRAAGLAARVHNVGIGGERTDQALARLEREVISQRPHLVTIMYGTNDSYVDPGKTESRLSEAAYRANLGELVRRLQAAGVRVVIMTEPCFAEEFRRNGLGEDSNVRLARYAAIAREVARGAGVALVDHFAGWAAEQAGGRKLQPWTTDGCHPSAEGHADLAARMLPVLSPIVRELSSTP
jgi:lysophospholipase L1-like esterase